MLVWGCPFFIPRLIVRVLGICAESIDAEQGDEGGRSAERGGAPIVLSKKHELLFSRMSFVDASSWLSAAANSTSLGSGGEI